MDPKEAEQGPKGTAGAGAPVGSGVERGLAALSVGESSPLSHNEKITKEDTSIPAALATLTPEQVSIKCLL